MYLYVQVVSTVSRDAMLVARLVDLMPNPLKRPCLGELDRSSFSLVVIISFLFLGITCLLRTCTLLISTVMCCPFRHFLPRLVQSDHSILGRMI